MPDSEVSALSDAIATAAVRGGWGGKERLGLSNTISHSHQLLLYTVFKNLPPTYHLKEGTEGCAPSNEGVNWERGMESESHSPVNGWQRKGIIRRMEKRWQGNQLYGTQRGKSIQNRVGEYRGPRSKMKMVAYLTQLNVRGAIPCCTEGFIRNLKNTKQFLKH